MIRGATKLRNIITRLGYKSSLIVSALAIVLLSVATIQPAHAALSSTSVRLSDSRLSATSQYTLTSSGFNTGQTIGCIEIDLGTSVDGTGSITGLSTASSTFVSQSITATGTWAVSNTASADHKLRLTNGTPVAPQSGAQTAVWGAVTNGSTPEVSYYAVFTTYTTNACTTPVDTVTIQLIYTNGQTVTATVGAALAFTITGTSSGTACNGATSDVTTTATTVPFGTVTTGDSKIGVQNLNVTTNSGSGYTVYTRYDGDLNSGSNLIDDHTGTNAAPTAFPSPGTEAYGYTTNDAVLGTGTPNRFTASGPNWAAFETTDAEVAYSNAAVTSQTTCVAQQVGIDATTPAGTYDAVVIYTAVPIY